MEETKEWYYAINENVYGPVCRSEIIWLFNNRRIFSNTKVWKSSMANWEFFNQTDLLRYVITSPSLHTAVVGNSSMWFVAFMPLISYIVSVLLSNTSKLFVLFTLWCIALVGMIICIDDERKIKKQGYDTKELLIWAILSKPIYLFRRAYLLEQRMNYAITCVVLYLFTWLIKIMALAFLAQHPPTI